MSTLSNPISHQNTLFSLINTTYLNILRGVQAGYPDDQHLQDLINDHRDDEQLFRRMVAECDTYDENHPEATISDIVSEGKFDILYTLDTFSFLSGKMQTYTDEARSKIEKALKELLLQFQVIRSCSDKWRIISPIIDTVRSTKSNNSVDFSSIMNLVTEINGDDNKLVKEFNNPTTLRHLKGVVNMLGMSLDSFEEHSQDRADVF